MYTNKEIWNVSYPIFLGLLAQNIINVTDTAFLGRVGEVELGASAMGGLFYICVFTIAFGFSTGSQIMIARRNGEGRFRDVGPVMMQGCAFLLILAVGLFGLTHAAAPSLIRLLISCHIRCYQRIFELAYFRFLFCVCQCHVPCSLYRYHAYEGTDLECHCHGYGECRVGLCPDFRSFRFACLGVERGCHCFGYC